MQPISTDVMVLIRYGIFMCAQKLMGDQLNLVHGTKRITETTTDELCKSGWTN